MININTDTSPQNLVPHRVIDAGNCVLGSCGNVYFVGVAENQWVRIRQGANAPELYYAPEVSGVPAELTDITVRAL